MQKVRVLGLGWGKLSVDDGVPCRCRGVSGFGFRDAGFRFRDACFVFCFSLTVYLVSA